LQGLVPDVALRSQIRLAYSDDTAKLLLEKGIGAQQLLDAAPTIKAMIGRWTAAAAGDVVKRVSDLGGSALLATFEANVAKDVTAARALQLLDCPANGLAWFISTGAAPANKLLDKGWPTADVTTLLRAAENDAKLGPAQLTTFVALVESITMPVATAEKLLKAGATAVFLIDHALSSIEKLLKVPWDVDKLVDLVKSANDLCKPDKAHFEKFCTLAVAPVTQDHAVAIMKGANCTPGYLVDTAFTAMHELVKKGWTTDQLKAFVKAAEDKAGLTKAQIDRFGKLVRTNNFTADNATACLRRPNVGDWNFLMDRVDDFIADGNKGAPAAMGGVSADSHRFGPNGSKITIQLQVARVQHFVDGHTYKHYVFTHDNIYRGGGNQPSSMWPRGTTASAVAAKALAAIKTPAVQALATNACAGTGSSASGDFDQADFGAYVAGIQSFSKTSTTLMQFFPNGTAVPPHTMAAIGYLFLGGI